MASILPPAVTSFFDNNGNPLAGGTVDFYIPNTSTRKNTYQDKAQTILNTNPVILDSRGEAIIWGSGSYRQVVRDSDGNLIWDRFTEDANAGLTGNITDDLFFAGVDFVPGSTTTLTLTSDPGSIANTWLFFDGMYQGDDQIQSLSYPTLTLTSPIPVGVQLVTVKIGTTVAIGVPADLSVTDAKVAPGSKLYNRIHDTISVKDYGAGSDKTAAQNKAAFKAAVAAAPVGGVLLVPDDGAPYVIDATGGLSDAIDINKRMAIRFEGDVKSNDGTMRDNPPCIFKVSGDDVTFEGTGRIVGDGTKNDLNAGNDLTFPRLIHVTGDRFQVTNTLTIDTPPKVGIELYGCQDADVRCKWIGGVVTYTIGNTAYFGVRTTGGGGHFLDMPIMRDASGGRLITGVFSGGVLGPSNDMTVSGDADVHEKLAYLFGDRNVVALWRVHDAQQTDIVRIEGSHNKVHFGYGYNIKGGVSVYDGTYNEISDITLDKVGQIAIYVGRLSGSYTGGFTGTKIRNITGTADGTSSGVSDGVFLNLEGADSSDIELDNITMQGFAKNSGEASIHLKMASGLAIRSSHVKNCFISDSLQSGIVLDRVVDSEVSNNQGRNISGSMLVELGGANNRWIGNQGRNIGTPGIAGLDASSYGEGNQYTSAPLIGKVTLGAAITTTVPHGGVAPNAIIVLQEISSAAGLMVVAKGRCYTGPSGTDFSITVANGTAAAGNEQFAYEILQ